MARTDTLGRTATRVFPSTDGSTCVQYHSTVVVRFTAETVTLQSGGWQTVTTKRRMNQASQQFNLGFDVYQKAHVWYVSTPDGVVEFEDGMTFPRRARDWDAGRGWRYAGSDA